MTPLTSTELREQLQRLSHDLARVTRAEARPRRHPWKADLRGRREAIEAAIARARQALAAQDLQKEQG